MSEWLNLTLRWAHVIFGIMWIGDSLLFNWLDRHFTPPEAPEHGVQGELWLVHSGGFYRLIKRQLAPHEMPKTLHWFRWEAAGTWLTGFALLWVVYYLGGVLIDPYTAPVGETAAVAIGLALLIAGWAVYDTAWRIPIPASVTTALLFSALSATAWGLAHVFTGRAMYLHVGALFGTIMVANVWMRILPAQRRMIAATREGSVPDKALADRAKTRSRHNSYLTYPVVFIMVSHHFPSTYGSEWGWAILMGFVAAGMVARHFVMARR